MSDYEDKMVIMRCLFASLLHNYSQFGVTSVKIPGGMEGTEQASTEPDPGFLFPGPPKMSVFPPEERSVKKEGVDWTDSQSDQKGYIWLMVHTELQEWKHKVDGKGVGAHLCLPRAYGCGSCLWTWGDTCIPRD